MSLPRYVPSIAAALGFAIAFGAGSAQGDFTGTPITFNSNGGWSFFQDPRAIIDNGQLIIGSVAGATGNGSIAGDADVTSYSFQTQTSTEFDLHSAFDLDDHACPAFTVLPDGRVMVIYSTHGGNNDLYWRVSTSPGEATSWSAEQTLVVNTANDGNGNTYSNPFYLSTPNEVVNFSRAVGYDPNYSVFSNINNTDNTMSSLSPAYGGHWMYWQNPGTGPLTGGNGRPYVKYASNGANTVWFATTEDSPQNYLNSLYVGYMQFNSSGAGTVYTSTGGSLGGLSTGTAPTGNSGNPPTGGNQGDIVSGTGLSYLPTDFTPIVKANAVYNGIDLTGKYVGWATSMQLDSSGKPYLGFVVVDNTTGAYGNDLEYYYAHLVGNAWQVSRVGYAGFPLYNGQNQYAGLMTVDPSNPNTIYVSADVNPATDAALIGPDGKQHWQILEGTTGNGGSTWSWTQITDTSSDNIRPEVTAGSGKEALVWMQGSYTSYTSYSTSMVGLVEALATTATWSGNVSANWSDGGNWSAALPVSGGALTFAASGAAGAALTDNLMTPGTYNVAGITFTPAAPAYTITPGSPGVNGFALTAALTNSSTNAQTINDAISLPNTQMFTTTAGGGDLALGGAISGAGGIVKMGDGTLILAGSNNFAGTTLVAAGTLALGNSAALASSTLDASGAGSLSFGTLASAMLGGLFCPTSSLTQGVTGNGTSGGIALVNASLAPVNLSVGNNNATTIYGGNLTGSGGSLTKYGAGLLTLAGSNSYSGGTTIIGGDLAFAASSALPAAGNITLAGGALVATPILASGSAAPVTDWLGKLAANPTGAVALPGGALDNENITLSLATSALSLGAALGGAATYGGTLAPSGTTYNLGGGGGTLVFKPSLTGAMGLTIGNGGGGNVILTTSNSYTGPTTITAGTLQLGAGAASGSLGSGAVANASVLALDRSDFYTFNSMVSGAGRLYQIGSGTVNLSGSCVYTGATGVNAGTLLLTGTLSPLSTLALGGGTFDYSPVSARAQAFNGLTVNAGASAVATLAAGTLALGAITRNVGGAVDFATAGPITTTTLNNTSGSDGILGPWAFFGTGANTLYAYNGPNTSGGSIGGYSYVGGNSESGTAGAFGGIPSGGSGTVNYKVAGSGTFQVMGILRSVDTINYTGGGATQQSNNSNILLVINGLMNTGSGPLTIGGGADQLNVQMGANRDLVVAAITSGIILDNNLSDSSSGASALTKVGSGTLILAGDDTYTGATTIGGGTLQIGNGGAPSGSGEFLASPTIADGGALVFNHSDALTYSGGVSGAGSLTKLGSGTLTLTGTNTYSDGTDVLGGTLIVNSADGIEDGSNLFVGAASSIFAPIAAGNPALAVTNDGAAAVPEPSALALLAAAIGCSLLWPRRR